MAAVAVKRSRDAHDGGSRPTKRMPPDAGPGQTGAEYAVAVADVSAGAGADVSTGAGTDVSTGAGTDVSTGAGAGAESAARVAHLRVVDDDLLARDALQKTLHVPAARVIVRKELADQVVRDIRIAAGLTPYVALVDAAETLCTAETRRARRTLGSRTPGTCDIVDIETHPDSGAVGQVTYAFTDAPTKLKTVQMVLVDALPRDWRSKFALSSARSPDEGPAVWWKRLIGTRDAGMVVHDGCVFVGSDLPRLGSSGHMGRHRNFGTAMIALFGELNHVDEHDHSQGLLLNHIGLHEHLAIHDASCVHQYESNIARACPRDLARFLETNALLTAIYNVASRLDACARLG